MRMKISTIIALTFFLHNYIYAQVYNSKKIYKYEISYSKAKQVNRNEVMYLVCYGTEWKLAPQQRKAVWVSSNMDIFGPNYQTGIIENDEKIWLHPPRHENYKILEYSPFPYVKFPLKIGEFWNWELALGDYWACEELGISGDDIMEYNYKIDCIENLNIYGQPAECYKIISKSINPKIRSSWKAWYNVKYGFVKMVYSNVDKSVIEFELVEFWNWDEYIQLNPPKNNLWINF